MEAIPLTLPLSTQINIKPVDKRIPEYCITSYLVNNYIKQFIQDEADETVSNGVKVKMSDVLRYHGQGPLFIQESTTMPDKV